MMKSQVLHNAGNLPILEKLDFLLKGTKNFSWLANGAEKNAIISALEKDTIIKQFESEKDQLAAFYLLLNSKKCPPPEIVRLLNFTGNESLASALQENEESRQPPNDPGVQKDEWLHLQKLIVDSIDRLSSHTMNLGLVLCFASGMGLITAKDREIIANSSTLEIDQLKKFYTTVSRKEEDAHGKLLKVLKMTNNNWALNVLGITE